MSDHLISIIPAYTQLAISYFSIKDNVANYLIMKMTNQYVSNKRFLIRIFSSGLICGDSQLYKEIIIFK